MRFISNEKLDEFCFKNRLIPPKLRRSLYASAEITGFQPPTPTTFRAIGNKNKLFELKYFQEFNQPESVKENVGLQIFNAIQMLPKNEDSSAGRARQILADGIRYQAELTRETNIRVAKEKVSSELSAVFKAKKARLEQAAEFLKQQQQREQNEMALEDINQALKALDEVANLAGVKVEPIPPTGPPPGGLRGRIRSVEIEPEEEPGVAEIKQGDPEPPPETGVRRMRRRTDEEKRQRAEEVMVTTTEEIEVLRKQLADKQAIGPPYGPRLQNEITGLETLIKKDEAILAKAEANFERLTAKIAGKSEMEPPMPEPLETPMPEQTPF